MDGERKSGNSVLSMQLDDDDDDLYIYVCVCVCVCVALLLNSEVCTENSNF